MCSFPLPPETRAKSKTLDGYKTDDLVWVCLPEALSRLVGGGQVKLFSIAFNESNEVSILLVTTSVTVDRDGKLGSQRVCVRNLFEEERTGNPSPIELGGRTAERSEETISVKKGYYAHNCLYRSFCTPGYTSQSL